MTRNQIGITITLLATTFSTGLQPAFATKPQPTAMSKATPTGTQPAHIPTSGLQIPFSTYTNDRLGVSFVYPKEWKEGKNDDKNCVVKFSGTHDGDIGEISLSKFEEGQDADTVKKLLDAIIFPKLKDYKKLQEQKVAIGTKRHIPAILEDTTLTMSGVTFQQRYVFFDLKNGAYALIFTTPGDRFNKLNPIYNHTLLSLRSTDTIGASANRAVAAQNNNTSNSNLAAFRSNITPVSFSYPEGWQVEQTNNKNEPVVIKGKNAEGNYAQINLYRGDMHPHFNIDNVADNLEKEYFEAQKDFRRVNRQNQNFGANSKVNGVIQENSFDMNGSKIKQMVAMFYQNDKCYALAMYAPGWKENDMRQLFHKVLATVQVQE